MDFSGFTGTVIEDESDNEIVYVDFDDESLRKLPIDYIILMARDDSDWMKYYFDIDDVEFLDDEDE